VQSPTLSIVHTVDRVATLIEDNIRPSFAMRHNGDPEVPIPTEMLVHRFLTWEAGWSAGYSEQVGIYVHVSTRGLSGNPETGEMFRGGPDLNVGFVVRCHRERAESGTRLAAYVMEALWDIAEANGFAPHGHNFTTWGKPDSVDWGASGTVLFGPLDGAPGKSW